MKPQRTFRPPRRASLAPWFTLTLVAAAVGQSGAQPTPEPAPAAADGASQDDRATETQRIIVTAQKRRQSAQSVPASVYAASGKTLEEAGVQGTESLDQLAAGLTVVATQPGQLNLSMRGIANLSGNLLAGPSVGYYQDEAPMSSFSQLMPQIAFWDAERVEVLRGPQGTLFGEGSMGGTVRVITNKPDATALAGRVSLGASRVAGGESGFTARAMINAPLVKDELAVRALVSRQDLLGWVDIPEIDEQDTNGGRQEDARIALRWTPTRQFTLDLSHDRQTLDNRRPFATSPGVYRPRDLIPAAQPVAELSTMGTEYDLTSLTAQYDFGFATLLATASWFEQHRTAYSDENPTVPLFFGGLAGTAKQLARDIAVDVATQEVRLVSNGDRTVNWTVGAFHKDDKRLQGSSGYRISVPALGIVDDESFTTVDARAKAWAVFGDVEWKLTPTLALQAGVRRYESDNTQVIRFDTTSAIFGTVAGQSRPSSGTSQATSPKFGFSWMATPRMMVYGRVAEGFRDGGSNYTVPSEPTIVASYGPEKVRAYELGLKTQPLSWMTVNAALYRNDWTDLQLGFVTPSGLYSYIQNAGKARSTGGEIEVAARPTSSLRIGLNLATVDATIEEDVLNAFGQPVANKGNRIPQSPRLQASVSSSYEFALPRGLGGVVSGNLSHRGASESDAVNFPETRNDKSTLLNLRFGVNAERWDAALFVTNLTNEKSTVQRQRFVGSTEVYSTYVQPRTIGVEFSALF